MPQQSTSSTPPTYQPLSAEDTPMVSSTDGKINIGIVAGSFLGKEGPIETHSPLLTLRLDIAKGGSMQIPIPADYNAILYPLDGSLRINGDRELKAKDMTVFSTDGEGITIEGLTERPGPSCLPESRSKSPL